MSTTAHAPLRWFELTTEVLAAHGLHVEVRGHCVGGNHVLAKGLTLAEARSEAEARGLVETMPEFVTTAQRAEADAWRKAQHEAPLPHRRPDGPGHRMAGHVRQRRSPVGSGRQHGRRARSLAAA